MCTLKNRFAYFVIVILLLPALCGCKMGVTFRLQRMYGKTVVFPTQVVEVNSGERMEDCTIPSGMMRLVILFDDSGKACQPCQANRIAEYFDVLDSCRVRSVLPIVLFSGGDRMDEAETLTKNAGYHYPIYFDENGEFSRQNRFVPKDMRYHFFLLDKSDKIVFVGNPASNKAAMQSFDFALDKKR